MQRNQNGALLAGARFLPDVAERSCTDQPPQGFVVFVRSFLQYVGGYLRRWGLFVPTGSFQPIAHKLLVIARRVAADAILVSRPEAR